MLAHFNDLKEKKVLVTGALRGIGREIAKALAKNNCHVIINYRSREEEAVALCKELERLGASATSALCFDISDATQTSDALQTYVKENGPIEGVVNNAGISRDQLLLRLKADDVNVVIDTNLKGAIYVTQALSRGFLKGKNVSIVNISSVVGLMGNAGQVAYSASKAGLIGLTKSVAKELASRKVRCNAICPGFITTEMTAELDEKTQKQYADSIALGEFGTGEDIANSVLFLLSETSKYITGEVIKVDGGIYI